MSHARTARAPITLQQAAAVVNRSAADARGVATVFSAFLDSSAIPDPVSVSLFLRARALLQEAVDFLDAAAQRLEEQ